MILKILLRRRVHYDQRNIDLTETAIVYSSKRHQEKMKKGFCLEVGYIIRLKHSSDVVKVVFELDRQIRYPLHETL